jgi:tRNA-dihydrouridine synthase
LTVYFKIIVLTSIPKDFRLVLAPMRGLTTRKFFDILHDTGEPDEYITEFLRVHPTSAITPEILDILENHTSSVDLSVQLLGKECDHFVRIVRLLQNYKIRTININFGCPMPRIIKKGVGGSFLTDLPLMDKIISTLTENSPFPISIKTRVGHRFSSEFPEILNHLSRHKIAVLYLHGRTVKGLYDEPIDLNCIKLAKSMLQCPVVANGNIETAEEAVRVLVDTHADGVMIGRAAISNPWIFRQIRELTQGKKIFTPSSEDYFRYIKNIIHWFSPDISEKQSASAIKKYVVPIADFLDSHGIFSHKIRRVVTIVDLMHECEMFFTSP